MIFPWTHSQWQQLIKRYQQQRLPHALIFNGLSGLGKLEFARQFAKSILCESPDENGHACQSCRSCTQFEADTHPDFHQLEPEEIGKALKIDQIRGLIEKFSLASHYNRHRVAILSPAEDMNQAAANSLLKSLEEPPANTLIILVTSQRSALPATILSRCQQVDFPPPGKDMALTWLNNNHPEGVERLSELLIMANGAPLKALTDADGELLALRDDIFNHFSQLALQNQAAITAQTANWLKSDNPAPIQWLYSWVSDLIKMKSHYEQSIVNSDKREELSKIALRVDLSRLYGFLDKLVEANRLQKAPLNKQMVLDDLFLNWQSVTMA